MFGVLAQRVYGGPVDSGPSLAWVVVVLLIAALAIAGLVLLVIVRFLAGLLRLEHHYDRPSFAVMLLPSLIVALIVVVQLRNYSGQA